MGIDRFNVVQQSDADLPPLMVPNENGEYVSYEDHARIVDELKRKLEEARKDAERIDFIESLAMYPRPWNYYIEHRFTGGNTFREAIDAAREKQG